MESMVSAGNIDMYMSQKLQWWLENYFDGQEFLISPLIVIYDQ